MTDHIDDLIGGSRHMRSPVDERLDMLGVRLGDTLRHTDKSVVYDGQWNDEPVVVKILVTDDPYWVARQLHERNVYRLAGASPVPVPQLRFADDQLIILDRIAGQPVSTARYPGPLPQPQLHRTLTMLDRLYTWQADGVPTHDVTRYFIVRYSASGLLEPTDRHAIEMLLKAQPGSRVEHGDLLASNVLDDGNATALVDLEHLGQHLPGTDWALMSLLWAPANPWLGDELVRRADRAGLTAPFVINRMLLACREVTIYEMLATEERERHQATIDANLSQARRALHAAHVSGTTAQ